MGHWVRTVALLGLTGCSLIYNPSNLPEPITDGDPPPDIMPDAEDKLDANPALLAIEQVFPTDIFEGTGTGGSRRGVITVHGMNIVSGAKISVAVHTGETGDPKITIDDDNTDVAANGNIVAAPFTLDINDQLGEGMSIRLDVTVTQPNGASTVSAMLTEKTPDGDDAVLRVVGLDEGTGALAATGTKEYSEVNADTISTTAGEADPVIIRARGRINVTGTVAANASGQTGGPGGNDGGSGGTLAAGATAGNGPGGAGSGGKAGSGGGGFATAGLGNAAVAGPPSGNPEITTLGNPNRSSGGGGGALGLNLNPNGGFGGGGGGSIELTAGGIVTLSTVEARGAAGEVVTQNDGGGGSGGVILLRGADVTATVDVTGGTGLNAGAGGRARVDSGTAGTAISVYRGVSIDKLAPIITKTATPTLTFYGADNVSFKYRIKSLNSSQVSNNLDGTIGEDGENSFVLGAPLFRGLNQVCVFVPGADLVDQKDEARNCIEITYLFTP